METTHRATPTGLREWCAVAALYTGVTLLFWWPILGRLRRQFIGDGYDTFQFVWNAWWMGRSVSSGSNPFYCDIQFAPEGVPLVLHTLAPLPSLLIAGLTGIAGEPLGFNLGLLVLCVGAGLGAFALTRYLTGDSWAAAVGGLVFMLSPFVTSKLLGHVNLLAAGLLPVYVLFLMRALETRSRGARVWLTIVFVLLVFSNVHMTIFAGNVTLWYWVYRGVRSQRWRGTIGEFWWALRPSLLLTVLWGGVVGYYAMRYGLGADQFRAPDWCAELLSFATPAFPTSVWGTELLPDGGFWPRMFNLEIAVYLGWLVLPVAIVGWRLGWREPRLRFLAIVFICALVLALGHKLQWQREIVTIGDMPVRLPLNVYRYVPILGAVGQSGRYMVMGYMAMAVGVGVAVAGLRRRWSARAAVPAIVIISIAILVDYAYRPPTVPPPDIVIPPGPGLVMDPRIGNAQSLYRQVHHGRPLVGGYVARVPRTLRAYYRDWPALGWFFTRPERRGAPPAADDVREALRARNIAYVIVSPGTPDAALLEQAGCAPIKVDGPDTIYRVPG